MSRLFFATFLLSAVPAASWGPVGHRAVGRIAENHLPQRTLLAVRDLLDGESLADIAVWADEVRSDPAWRHSAPWHYVNIADDETYGTAPKNPAGDILEALERFEKTLQNSSAPRRERADALKFLAHLVGDLHQPLHVGRASDRGGNDTAVEWLGAATNLHWVWDAGILESRGLSAAELAARAERASDETIRAWRRGDYREWAQESFDLRHEVYEIGEGKLGRAYAATHYPTAERRILQAGVRLAGVLEKLF